MVFNKWALYIHIKSGFPEAHLCYGIQREDINQLWKHYLTKAPIWSAELVIGKPH